LDLPLDGHLLTAADLAVGLAEEGAVQPGHVVLQGSNLAERLPAMRTSISP
jgi:hypothetical protein